MAKETPAVFLPTDVGGEDMEPQPYLYPGNAVGEPLPMRVMMIVPTRGGNDGVAGETLAARWRGQTLKPDVLIIVRGAANPAAGRNTGFREAVIRLQGDKVIRPCWGGLKGDKETPPESPPTDVEGEDVTGGNACPSESGDVVIFSDDDGEPCDDRVLETVVTTLLSDGSIWMAGAAIKLPPSATLFQRRYARQVGRCEVDAPDWPMDSDLATTLCAAMRARHFSELGGFDERLTAGEDPELRDRIRQAGGKVVLAPGAAVYHPPPEGWRRLWRRGFWYGLGEAQMAKLYHGDSWRRETKARGWGYYLLKGVLAPVALILDWEVLRQRRFRLDWQPLRVVHTWADVGGYWYGLLRRGKVCELGETGGGKVEVIKL